MRSNINNNNNNQNLLLKQENNYENNYDNRLELNSKLKDELKDINKNDLEQIKGISSDPEVSVSNINSKLGMHKESAEVVDKINKGYENVRADSSSMIPKLFLFINKLPN